MKKALIAAAFLLVPCFSLSAGAQSVLKDHDTYQALDISAERLELQQKQGRAIYKGAVQVIQGDMTLTSDILTVFFESGSEGGNPNISRLDAQGAVKLISKEKSFSGTGNWGIYDVERRLITIGGNVVFTQNNNTLRGSRLEINLETGLAKLDGQSGGMGTGRVTGTFNVPKKKDSKN
ncbi:MAG: OstA family protein [Kordiimonadales bacterium]|nr:MAG: OstA family protein [Kordiimonadales bacterium]